MKLEKVKVKVTILAIAIMLVLSSFTMVGPGLAFAAKSGGSGGGGLLTDSVSLHGKSVIHSDLAILKAESKNLVKMSVVVTCFC